MKAGLYARASVSEYWVLDVTGHRLIVHRNPARGKYETVAVYSENEAVYPQAAPEAEFRPEYAFPQ
jgi:Uma2 family endonuclease